MIPLLKNIIHLSWAIWFGGMMVLLLFVTQLFKKSHATGVDAAPVLFDTFANFQLVVGGIACIAATILSALTRRKSVAALTLLLLVAFAAAILLCGWTHQIDRLQALGQNQTPRFKHLHARTGIAYVAAAGALLLSGLGWLNVRLTHRTATGIEPAIGSPAATSDQFSIHPAPPVPIRPE